MAGAPELLVIGAGPAGVGCATAAAAHGVDVVLVDENDAAGGQVYRDIPSSFRVKAGAPVSAEQRLGAEQRALLQRSPVQTAFGHRVWSVLPGFRVDALGPEGPVSWTARALALATGTSERVVPFPGWTLPGVIGLAAATILLKSQQTLPGESTLVAGCGPLLAAVAVGILKGGGRVAAVADLSGPDEWLRALPALAARPDLLVRGMTWTATIRAAGVPIFFRHGIKEVREADGELEAVLQPVDRERRLVGHGAERLIRAECVAVGHGLVPGTDVTRLLRARHRFDAALGGWVAERDADFRTSIANLYVAGDGAGISGAAAAFLQGQIAGLSAARDLGRLDAGAHVRAVAPIRSRLARAERFGRAMARLMALRPGQVASIPPDTVVCRCEDVTRAEIDEAVGSGAREVNQLKAWTRCGMGPCQGRMCGESAASLVSAWVGDRERAGYFTGRAPLRPVSLDALTGDYDYADIPIPKAAPL